MKSLHTIFLLFLFSSAGFAMETDWFLHLKDGKQITGSAIVVDANGYSYTTGSFNDSILLKGPGGTRHLYDSGFGDAFIVKLDPCGNMVWVRQLKGSSRVAPYSIALNSKGYVITAGSFSAETDFDPGPKKQIINPNGGNAIYISILDNDGNYVDALRIGGSPGMYGPSLAIDEKDNIYVSANFSGGFPNDPVNVNPKGSHFLKPDGLNSFILKLDPAGNFLWANHMKGRESRVIKIAVSGENVYATGSFYERIVFEKGTGTTFLDAVKLNDAFLLKITGDNRFEWVQHFKTSGKAFGTSLKINPTGGVYFSGFYGQGDLELPEGSGSVIFKPSGNNNVYFGSCTPSGQNNWVRQLSATDNVLHPELTVSPAGKLYINGIYEGLVDLDPGPGEFNLSSLDTRIFVAIFNQDGTFSSAMDLEIFTFYPSFIDVSPEGNIYLTGQFNKANIETDTGIISITPAFPGEGIIHKIAPVRNRELFEEVTLSACEGDSFVLEPDLWIGDEVLWGTGEVTPSITIRKGGKYTLRVKNCNRLFFDTVQVEFGPKPMVYIGPDTAFCDLIKYLIKPVTENAERYLWNTGDTTQTLLVTREGEYNLRVETGHYCADADTTYVSKVESPAGPGFQDTAVCGARVLRLSAGNPGSNYKWSTGEEAPEIIVSENGIYKVTISNGFCTIRDSIKVTFPDDEFCRGEFFMPNAFSPNGDGHNDVFLPVGQNIRSMDLQIFNRWGELIYQTNIPLGGWDGTLRDGRNAPPGLYLYRVTYSFPSLKNGQLLNKSRSGTVHLIY